jgi:hypothetical protein
MADATRQRRRRVVGQERYPELRASREKEREMLGEG